MVASGGDLIGILFFVVVAILSALSKRAGQRSEEEGGPARPVRRVPPRGTGAPDAPPMLPDGQPDLAGEMRRFLDELQRGEETPAPETRPVVIPQPEPSRPHPVAPTFHPPRTEVKVRRVVRVPVPSPVVVEAAPAPVRLVTEPTHNIHQEVMDSMQTLRDDVRATREELQEGTPAAESAAPTPAPVFGGGAAWFRSPQGLRQAVIASEVLGPPRALRPF